MEETFRDINNSKSLITGWFSLFRRVLTLDTGPPKLEIPDRKVQNGQKVAETGRINCPPTVKREYNPGCPLHGNSPL